MILSVQGATADTNDVDVVMYHLKLQQSTMYNVHANIYFKSHTIFLCNRKGEGTI